MSRLLGLVQDRHYGHEHFVRHFNSVLIIDFQEMWWGSTQMMGNPEKKNCSLLKLTKMIQQSVDVDESCLHLFLHPLSFHTITMHHMDGLQTLLACLQFQIDLQNNIHPFLHLLSDTLFLVLHALMLHTRPFVFQPLQILLHILHDDFITSCNRHLDSAQTSHNCK